jgi:hypothetical protein
VTSRAVCKVKAGHTTVLREYPLDAIQRTRSPSLLTLTTMMQPDFWNGVFTAVALFGTVAISCIFNIYMGTYQDIPTVCNITLTNTQVV